ncbi:hypothetical protein SOASR032_26160 [Pragia fontium]|uniref:GmrSD restriction endonucleases N-terminal domain-containing protein n=1 Tax=Pragia fontium TaxID=82985 RepID=A0ABQ5LMC6_9GAMM|nr:DUF262 domain-containing protein [Pragia fontium]GKX64047.1 hypothetical protein SOASR032_26160 [Pragia fontium]
MINNVDYKVRSISLLNLISDMRAEKLIPDAYFQRNLVWREIHKKEFIETILLGFPFPQIFVSKGKVDVASMKTTSCIIDGQQRTNAILDFIVNKFSVNGKTYNDLTDDEKAIFLKYEIAVIELDLENDDPRVVEIFKRINRTSNSLTTIEKYASEYSTVEFMLVAKLLTNQIDLDSVSDGDNDNWTIDPNIPEDFILWAKKQKVNNFPKLIIEKGIYSSRDLIRKAHLMHVLNMIATYIYSFFNRNEKSFDMLNDPALNFSEKDEVIRIFEEAATLVLKMKLPTKSYWLNKANFFSLFIVIANVLKAGKTIDLDKFKMNLALFYDNLPDDYRLSASEAVNNKKERAIRDSYLTDVISTAIV